MSKQQLEILLEDIKELPEPSEVKKIDLDLIDVSPYQPRSRVYEDSKESVANIVSLSSSMNRVGLLENLMVRPVGERFELISGHRRLRAAKLLKWDKIRCAIYRGLSEATVMYVVGTDNFARDQVKPYELGRYFRKWMNINYKIPQLAELFPYSVQAIQRFVALNAAVDMLMTGLSEKQQAKFIESVPDSTLKLLVELSKGGGEPQARTMIRIFLQGEQSEEEINTRIKRTLNALTSHEEEVSKNVKPSSNALLGKLRNVETQAQVRAITAKLEKDIEKSEEKEAELEIIAEKYQNMMKASRELHLEGQRVKVTHDYDKQKGILKCVHIMGKKTVTLTFKI